MDEVLVGDIFKLPVSIDSSGSNIRQANGARLHSSKMDLMGTCIAINNHDRLIADKKLVIETAHNKNKELREEVESLSEDVSELRQTLATLKEMVGNASGLVEIEAFLRTYCDDKQIK